MSLLIHLRDWLLRSDLPNAIQVASGAAAAYAWRKLMCKQPRCPRLGKHKVEGTTYRTCSKHATVDVHEALKEAHKVKRPAQHELLSRHRG